MFRRFANNLAFIVVATVAPIRAAAERHWDFSSDPGWDVYRNRLLPDPLPRTTQNFGYRQSNHAGGKSPGEIGGFVQRSLTPASYAKAIPAKTLNDKLSASGRFAVTNDESASGVLFGWFHESSRGWRTPNSLVVRLDGNGRKLSGGSPTRLKRQRLVPVENGATKRVAPHHHRRNSMKTILASILAVAFLAVIPLYLIYYVVQPLPSSLVCKQIVFDTVCTLILGAVVAFLYRGQGRA